MYIRQSIVFEILDSDKLLTCYMQCTVRFLLVTAPCLSLSLFQKTAIMSPCLSFRNILMLSHKRTVPVNYIKMGWKTVTWDCLSSFSIVTYHHVSPSNLYKKLLLL